MSRKYLFGFLSVALITAGIILWQWLFSDLPAIEDLATYLHTPSVRVTDRNGRVLYDILPEQEGRHTVVPLESLPPALIQATIATEDETFYANPGVDLRGILRAFWINLQGGETLAGGSTITQQVARNLLLSSEERSERTLRRKLRESYLAWQLARRYSKDEILSLYLNQVYYGGMAYGVEAAAQTFFAKPASELDLAECALLAGLPQAPASYNPFSAPDKAKKRQAVVLKLMQEQGLISAEEAALAQAEALVFAAAPYPMEAPHFVQMIRSQLDRYIAEASLRESGGITVRTTLNLDWQHQAERVIRQQLAKLQKESGVLSRNVNNAALVALDPQTGEILAMVGSPDYNDTESDGAVNMALSPRQPGSSIKPLIYAAAFDPSYPHKHGEVWTPATMILDVSTTFLTKDGKAYTPVNYDGLEHGPVLARQALGSSLNIPAVIALDEVGLQALFDLATKMGISTMSNPERYDLSLALGGGEVSLLELTAAYAAFANGGYRVDPVSILEITNARGEVLYQWSPKSLNQVRILDERIAWLISDILSDNDARRLGFGPYSTLQLDRPAAVKTGTTTNFHDNWTIGYTPQVVTGVWVGNTSYEPMRNVSGISGAGPIWHQFMRKVLAGLPVKWFKRPPGLVSIEICSLSGLLPTDACQYRRQEWFIEGTQPHTYDHFYRQVTIDKTSGRLADENTPPDQQISQIVLDLPARAQPWARRQGLVLLSDLSLASSQANTIDFSTHSNSPAIISLLSPANKAVFYLSSAYSNTVQSLHLQAVVSGKSIAEVARVTLWVDGKLLASLLTPPFETWWPLTLGQHQTWAELTLNSGETIVSAPVMFQVLPNP